jgi:hypothetical protein
MKCPTLIYWRNKSSFLQDLKERSSCLYDLFNSRKNAQILTASTPFSPSSMFFCLFDRVKVEKLVLFSSKFPPCVCAFYGERRCGHSAGICAQLPTRALFTDIIPQFGDARRCKIISSLAAAAKKSQRKLRRFGAVNVLECADNIIMRHQAGNQQHTARVHPPCTLLYACGPLCFICICMYGVRPHTHTSQHSAIQRWRRCLHTHMHALHLQKGNQGSNCIENSQEKANGPKLVRRRLEAAAAQKSSALKQISA